MARAWYLVFFVLSISEPIMSDDDEEHDDRWSYDGDDGPSHWGKAYPTCSAASQSPVDIQEKEALPDTSLQSFKLRNYSQVLNLNFTNNGHTLQGILSSKNISIEGGSLKGKYVATQLHFHWGRDNSRGSEHTINKRSYPMEMHVVHYAEKYRNFSNAVKYKDGLAVLGFLFEIVSEDNFQLEPLVSRMQRFHCPGSIYLSQPLVLQSLLPRNLETYFRYNGSLTTPPCSQSVIWTVFETPIHISNRQLKSFRELFRKKKIPGHPANNTGLHVKDVRCSAKLNEKLLPLQDNYRPVQSMNTRKILKRMIPKREATWKPSIYYISHGHRFPISQKVIQVPIASTRIIRVLQPWHRIRPIRVLTLMRHTPRVFQGGDQTVNV